MQNHEFSKLTAYLNTLEEKYGVHGLDMKITRGHETVYRCMLGHSDYERKTPVSERICITFTRRPR